MGIPIFSDNLTESLAELLLKLSDLKHWMYNICHRPLAFHFFFFSVSKYVKQFWYIFNKLRSSIIFLCQLKMLEVAVFLCLCMYNYICHCQRLMI